MTEQAQNTDNLSAAETTSATGSLLSSATPTQTETDAATTQPDTGSDFGYVPEKFLVDGKPDFEKLSKSYTALEQKLGGKAPVSDVAEYDFTFQNPENWDEAGFNSFKTQALELGLSKDQFNTAMQLYEQNVSSLTEQLLPSQAKAEAALKQEWGNNYEANLKLASKAINTFAPEGFDVDAIGNDPNVIKLLSVIGKQLGEDTLPNAQSTQSSRMSKLEVEALMASPDYISNREKQRLVTQWYEATYRD